MSGSLLTDGDPEELIHCPIDPVHLLRRKRMPYHLQKCSKNFNMRDFKICPFNNRHVVQKDDFQAHLALCQDKGILEREMLFHQEDSRQDDMVPIQKGYTDVPVSTFMPPEPGESWDDSNVRVDINPRESLFNNAPAMDQQSRSPKKKENRVRDPPRTRDPVMTRGSEEVFKLATAEVPVYTAPLVVKARGRGRGRGIPVSPSKVGAVANGDFQQVSPGGAGVGQGSPGAGGAAMRGVGQVSPRGAAMRGVRQVSPGGGTAMRGVGQVSPGGGTAMRGVGRGRGVAMHVPAIPQAVNSEEEEKKQARKLRKMLKQIIELQEKQDSGQELNEDQTAKLSRKEDVLLKLEQLGQLHG